MKKEYNRNIMADLPLDTSLNENSKPTSTNATNTTKPKINAIGKKATNVVKNKSQKNKAVLPDEVNRKSSTRSIDLLDDLDRLNEENIKTFQTKSKRNKVVIVLLAISIAVAITVLSVYLAIIRMEINCRLYVHGADAVYYVDGEQMSSFRAPSDTQGNRILRFELELKIEESGYFNIKFHPECFQAGVALKNTLIYDANIEMFEEMPDGSFQSRTPIQGNQTIRLCGGVILDYSYKDTLNVNNFRMEFHTNLQKV